MKGNKFIIIAIVIVAVLILYKGGLSYMGAFSGESTVVRSGPNEVVQGHTFDIVYTATGITTPWAASIQDSVSGGCKFPGDKTSIRDLLISDTNPSITVTVNAPSAAVDCVFSGDYKFGTLSVVAMTSKTVSVVTESQQTPTPTPTGTVNPTPTTTCNSLYQTLKADGTCGFNYIILGLAGVVGYLLYTQFAKKKRRR